MEDDNKNNSIEDTEESTPQNEEEFKLEKNRAKKKILILIALILIAIPISIFIASRYPTPSLLFVKPPKPLVEGCKEGDLFSSISGVPCKELDLPPSCQEGDIYNRSTGESCAVE